jgi:hypothetical protein
MEELLIIEAGGTYSYNWALKGEKMVLFLVNAHQIDICAPVSLHSCGGRKVLAPPLCIHQDRSWVRQRIIELSIRLISVLYCEGNETCNVSVSV